MKIIELIGTFFWYLGVEAGFLVWRMAISIVKGPIRSRLLAICIYAGLTALCIYKPPVLFVLAGLLLTVLIVFDISLMRDEYSDSDSETADTLHVHSSNENRDPFYGMTEDEAKAEYRRLLKLYHPDNGNGDIKKTQDIVIAYSNYCKRAAER